MLFRKDLGAEAAAKHGEKRSPQWGKARKDHLKIEPSCAVCLKKRKGAWAKIVSLVKPVQVHHIYPFHIIKNLGRPELELDQRNLITLCESGEKHHISLGHLGDFQSFNPNVKEHAEKTFAGKKSAEIVGSPLWKALHGMRPKDLEKMTPEEKKTLREEIDQVLPFLP